MRGSHRAPPTTRRLWQATSRGQRGRTSTTRPHLYSCRMRLDNARRRRHPDPTTPTTRYPGDSGNGRGTGASVKCALGQSGSFSPFATTTARHPLSLTSVINGAMPATSSAGQENRRTRRGRKARSSNPPCTFLTFFLAFIDFILFIFFVLRYLSYQRFFFFFFSFCSRRIVQASDQRQGRRLALAVSLLRDVAGRTRPFRKRKRLSQHAIDRIQLPFPRFLIIRLSRLLFSEAWTEN